MTDSTFSAAEEPQAAPSAAASFGSLLFQAPDFSAVRKRPVAEADSAENDDDAARTPRASVKSRKTRHRDERTSREKRVEVADQESEATQDESTDVSTAEEDEENGRKSVRRRRGGRGRRSRVREEEEETTTSASSPEEAEADAQASEESSEEEEGGESGSLRRRRRRRTRTRSDEARDVKDEVTALKGSTRLEAKRQRRREGRAAGRRRPIVTEAEFLARRESVDRQMIVREKDGLNQIAVLEDDMLVEHYVARHTQTSMVGNVYIGRVQNVLPSMEAAFVDLGKGRNAVLYAGEVNWDAAGLEGKPRRIEDALKSGDTVVVQVTKDPIGHKGARLTSQITLAGRHLVLVPGGSMTGISRKLPDTERGRLKRILKQVVPAGHGVIVRTAAEGATEEQLAADVQRLTAQWEQIQKKVEAVNRGSGKAPLLLKGEPELALRVVRDVFSEDFRKLIVSGSKAWQTISEYVTELSPELADRLEHWVSPVDVFTTYRVEEQLAKAFDRKVWLPSGGTLVIDRTEAMTVIDVNTGRFTGAGGTLEETVTRNNLEAAEEIVRQLRLRDIGGMVVIDFVDMVLESNRDLVLRRLIECLGRDRTRHQVTEVTSLGLVQMTRKRVGQGLVEAFSTPCEHCNGRGFIVHDAPVENQVVDMSMSASAHVDSGKRRRKQRKDEEPRRKNDSASESAAASVADESERDNVRNALAQIATAAERAHDSGASEAPRETARPPRRVRRSGQFVQSAAPADFMELLEPQQVHDEAANATAHDDAATDSDSVTAHDGAPSDAGAPNAAASDTDEAQASADAPLEPAAGQEEVTGQASASAEVAEQSHAATEVAQPRPRRRSVRRAASAPDVSVTPEQAPAAPAQRQTISGGGSVVASADTVLETMRRPRRRAASSGVVAPAQTETGAQDHTEE
ncbi:ribonuclease E/G [Actinomyces graevenitzii]|uniref:Rne/Rng family ribonuclease n=1 Tax=Actinomyces graevenitzii TaxID=55565 RepID=UPI000C7FD197|nr:Rne/Rng family ribonuclease [Actinomyces graevenitzii]PMC92179.1 ribonuclease E/G [Actinomyces graevenitzii]